MTRSIFDRFSLAKSRTAIYTILAFEMLVECLFVFPDLIVEFTASFIALIPSLFRIKSSVQSNPLSALEKDSSWAYIINWTRFVLSTQMFSIYRIIIMEIYFSWVMRLGFPRTDQGSCNCNWTLSNHWSLSISWRILPRTSCRNPVQGWKAVLNATVMYVY